ncbi:MAG TPA: HD domain-containing phosphohydrolase [Gemmatimonadales bacterium]|nr:HD domain-containing phosphohydrolase [Gemmatimonadales bacterium]
MSEDSQGQRPGSGDEGFLRHAGRGFLLTFYAALRALKLYPVENAAVQKALEELQASAVALLERENELELRLSGDFLFINGTRLRLELDNFAAFSNLLTTLRAFDIGIFRTEPGVERREWQALLSILLSVSGDTTIEDRYIALVDRLGGAGVPHIDFEPQAETADPLDSQAAREVAKRTYSHGVAVTKEVVNSIRLGRTSSVKKVKRAVQMIVDQVLTNETSILGLTALRDYDEYTFTHSVNVCIFAVALGRKIGLTKLQLYDLGMTALLHDIGKAKIPIDILNKTHGLADEEWRVIQAHPWGGAMTLFGLRGYQEIPYMAILVAHEHHMKTDLSGYPRAIRPRSLGIFSRIVAVADGFDAATTRRSYQTVPIEPDQVLREMWNNPKRGYDPIVVKALINLLGVYPIGTCVILDTLEVAIVSQANPDPQLLNRPAVRIAIEAAGGLVPPPGILVDLTERGPDGNHLRSIVKVTNPERYNLTVGDYFL